MRSTSSPKGVNDKQETEVSGPGAVDLRSRPARIALGKAVMRLFDLWGLSSADRLNLLGLSPKSRSLLTRYARGTAAPKSEETIHRIGWLFGIHKSLRILLPHPDNKEQLYSWVKYRNTAFHNRTPLEVMKEQGVPGIYLVADYLENILMR